MKAVFVAFIFLVSCYAGPVPGRFDDQVSQPATVQKNWIDDFMKVFQVSYYRLLSLSRKIFLTR